MEINKNEHLTITGCSQSGKSYLGKHIFRQYPSAVFYDFKWDPAHSLFIKNYVVVSTPKSLLAALKKHTHVVYRPPSSGSMQEAINYFDMVCRIIYKRGNTALFVDETANLCSSGLISPYHYRLITMGMSRGCAVIHCTQKPVFVNNSVYSESVNNIIFQIKVKGHREKLRGIVGDAAIDASESLSKYEFIFVSENQEFKHGKLKGPKR